MNRTLSLLIVGVAVALAFIAATAGNASADQQVSAYEEALKSHIPMVVNINSGT